MTEARFNIVKATNKADTVPEYLRGISNKQVIAYYFNWNTDKQTVTVDEIDAWYLEKRGWKWEMVKD